MINKQNKTRKNIFSQRGISLIEVLVAMFISLAVIGAAYTVYLVSSRSYKRGEQITDLTQNGRIAMDRMVREIRQTNEIVTENFPPDDQQTPANEIEFQDGHITDIPGEIQYIRYFLDSSDLRRQRLIYYCPSAPEEHVHKLFECPNSEEMQSAIYNDEDYVIAEKLQNLEFYGLRLIAIYFEVVEEGDKVEFTTQVFGRNIT